MIIVDKFNALDGKTLSRDEINELISEAIGQDQTIIAQRLQNVLNRYDSERIEFIIDNPAIEETPVKGLSGIYDFDTPEEEFNGLAKSVSPNDAYNMITARMIEMVEKASGKEYQKKWGNKAEPMQGYLIPFNFATKKRYRGVNLFLLTEFQPISNPFFMTFKQIEERKARVKKGAKGFPVIYFTQLYTYQQTEPDLQFGTYDKEAFKKWVISNKSDIHPLKGNKPLSIDDLIFQSTIPILKYYNVFNGADIEGIDFDLDNFKTGYINIEAPATEENRIAAAEAIIEHFPEPTPNYVEKGNVASYSPGADLVKMPPFKTFDTAQDFYRTLFHEYSHSTGHPDRLNREFGRKFGDKKYAFEELVAEWGAVFLSAEAGIIFHDQKNHAEYLKNWSRSLAFAEKDNKFIMKAATQAQKVADYVLQFDAEGNPKYLKHLKPDETPIEIKKPENDAQTKKKPSNKAPKISPKSKKGNRTTSTKKTGTGNKKSLLISKILESSFAQFKREFVVSNWEDAQKSRLEYYIDNQFVGYSEHNDLNNKGLRNIYNYILEFKSLPKAIKEKTKTPPRGISQGLPQCNTKEELDQINPKGVKKGLKAADQNPNSLAYRLQNRNRVFESYKIDNADIAEFLGTIEIKEKESVAITLTGTQGSMKTRFIFQVMNALGQNYKIGHASIEEHPESSLYFYKVDEYLNETAIANITSPEISTIEDVHKLVRENDVIVIDSFSKLQELDPKIQLDKDFRKKYHGKLFIIIYQTTSDGKMRGGSKSQFDGDIILFIEKFSDYTQNYVYPDKNRYNKRNCSELKYNIFLQKLMIPEAENEPVQSEPETQNTEPIELNFNVN